MQIATYDHLLCFFMSEASKHFYQELPKIFARRIEEDQRLLHGLESP